MRLSKLRIERAPGISPAFELDELGWLNLIHGPNGSGKSTVLRVLRALLWPESMKNQLQQYEATATFSGEGKTLLAHLRYSQVEWQSQGAVVPAPQLPSELFASSFTPSLIELLNANDADTLAQQISRELAGGFDLPSLKEGFRIPGNCGNSENRRLKEARLQVRRIQEEHEGLESRELQSPEKQAQAKELQKEIAQEGTLNRLLEFFEDRRKFEEVQTSLRALPEGLEKLGGAEVEQIEKLNQVLSRLQRETSERGILRRQKEAEIAEINLDQETLSDELLSSAETRARALLAGEERLTQWEAAYLREQETILKLSGAFYPAAAFDLKSVNELEILLEQGQRVKERRSQVDSQLSLLENEVQAFEDTFEDTEGSGKTPGESPAELDALVERCQAGATALRRWLSTPGVSTQKSLHFFLALGAGVLAILAGFLFGSVWGWLFVVAGVAVVGLSLWFSRPSSDPRTAWVQLYEQQQLEPVSWQAAAVEEALAELDKKHAQLRRSREEQEHRKRRREELEGRTNRVRLEQKKVEEEERLLAQQEASLLEELEKVRPIFELRDELALAAGFEPDGSRDFAGAVESIAQVLSSTRTPAGERASGGGGVHEQRTSDAKGAGPASTGSDSERLGRASGGLRSGAGASENGVRASEDIALFATSSTRSPWSYLEIPHFPSLPAAGSSSSAGDSSAAQQGELERWRQERKSLLEGSSLALVLWAQRLGKVREAVVKAAETLAGLKNAQAQVLRDEAALHASFRQMGLAIPQSSSGALAVISGLRRNLARLRELHLELRGLEREIESFLQQKLQAEQELDEIWKRVELADTQLEELRHRQSRLAEYRELSEKKRELESRLRSHQAQLQPVAKTLPKSPEEAELRLNKIAIAREELDALNRELGALDAEIRRHRRGKELEQAKDIADRAWEDLLQSRESAFDRELAGLWVDSLHQEHEERNRPAALALADEYFRDFTKHAYGLTLQGSEFRGVDLQSGLGLELSTLSDGTRLQLFLAVKLAFAALQQKELKLPLLLDEVLGTTDPARFEAISQGLYRLVEKGWQVFHLTSQPAEVEAWRHFVSKLDPNAEDTALRTYDLAQIRQLQSAGPAALLSTPPPRPSIPSVEGHSAESYADLIKVDPLKPFEGAKSQHLFYLFEEELPLLHQALESGFSRVGPFHSFIRSRDSASGSRWPEQLEVDARVEIMDAVLKAWCIGRNPPLPPGLLSEAGVTERFIEEVAALLRELNGDAGELIKALEAGSVKGFLARTRTRMQEFFEAEGYLDPAEVLDPEGLWSRVLNSIQHVELPSGWELPRVRHEFDRLLHRLELLRLMTENGEVSTERDEDQEGDEDGRQVGA